jgi:hypothetical protein
LYWPPSTAAATASLHFDILLAIIQEQFLTDLDVAYRIESCSIVQRLGGREDGATCLGDARLERT